MSPRNVVPRLAADEQSLLVRIRAGDRAAYETLFREYYVPLCRYVRGYAGSREATEDVVQDVLGRVWEARDTLVVRESVGAYLYAAVRHRVLNLRRRGSVERRWEAAAVAVEHMAPSADAAADERELAAAVAKTVASLPARCREAFLLRRQHGLSYAEIAAVMGIAPKTVEVQIGLALKALRTALAAWITQ